MAIAVASRQVSTRSHDWQDGHRRRWGARLAELGGRNLVPTDPDPTGGWYAINTILLFGRAL